MQGAGERRKELARRTGMVVVGGIGLVSGLATLLPIVPWYAWLVVAGAVGVGGFGWAAFTTRTPHLPIDEILLPVDEEEAAEVEVPPPLDILHSAAGYARRVYGPDALSFEDLQRWHAINPWVFLVLRSGRGRYLGHADVLPLTETGVRLLGSGTILESELPLSEILPPERANEAEALYLAGITVIECRTAAGKRRAAQLIGALVEYTELMYPAGPRRMVAIAASEDGRRLLEGLGARVVGVAEGRKDRHDFFEVELSPHLLGAIRLRAGRRATPAGFRLRFPTTPSPPEGSRAQPA